MATLPAYPPHSRVGSWLSTHECLAHLARRGHHVEVVDASRDDEDLQLVDGVTVHGKRISRRELIGAADVVVSHLGDQHQGAKWAKVLGRPSVRMVHGWGPAGHIDLAALLDEWPTALAVYNTEATRQAIGWRGPHITVAPPVWPERYRTTPGDRITLVNLAPAKGGDLFWELARRAPHRRWLGVLGGYGPQVLGDDAAHALLLGDGQIGSVQLLRTQTDPVEIYRLTRVILMPSERESYGRVAVEAACSGIPTIAHPTPGLLEALGDSAIWCDRDDPDAWLAALDQLDTEAAWSAWSARAQALAEQLDPASDLDRFADAIETLAVTGAAA